MLSRNKDADLTILMKLDDRSLIDFCIASGKNEYGIKLCSNEDFWRNRLQQKFPKLNLLDEYWKNQSFKEKYLKIIYYVDKMKREYNLDFLEGDPKLTYRTIKIKTELYNKISNDRDPSFQTQYKPVFKI